MPFKQLFFQLKAASSHSFTAGNPNYTYIGPWNPANRGLIGESSLSGIYIEIHGTT